MIRFTALPVAAGILILFLPGCSGGGSGGSGTTSTAGAAHIVSVTDTGNDQFLVEYTISDSSEPCSIQLEYSEDLGNSFQVSSHVTGASVLPRSMISRDLVWYAAPDLGAAPQGDIVIRITPRGEESGTSGLAACSDPFPFRSNSAPQITSCEVLASPTGNPAALHIAAYDAEGDTVEVAASIKTAESDTFESLSIVTPQSNLIQLTDEETTASLACDAYGTLGEGFFSEVIVRITVSDSTAFDTAETAPFALNTCRPLITRTTIQDIPEAMNGSAPFTNMSGLDEQFSLLVPPVGFSIKLAFDTINGGANVDPSTLSFSVNKSIGPEREISENTDLGALFTWDDEAGEAVLAIDNSLMFSPGAVYFSAEILDQMGNTSASASYSITVAAPGQAAYPFSQRDRWALRFNRDYWTIDASCDGDDVTVEKEFSNDGRADFLEDLSLIGLYNFDTPELSDNAAAYVKERVLVHLRRLYSIESDGTHTAESPDVQFTLDPAAADSVIGIGGSDPSGGYTLGRAYYDRCNRNRESNTTSTLGVFTTNLIRFYINTSYTFKNLFNPFIPERGDPIGTLAVDATILGDGFVYGAGGNSEEEDARFLEFQDAADGFGRAVAAILAHEIGHSLGLVANGPPPEGLFGGEENASFTGYWTNPYHIDTEGNNIMEAAISFSATQYTGTYALRFNELNKAYLLESVLLEK